MRTNNMFYGYKRLCDQRVNGVARYHKDGFAEVVEAVKNKVMSILEDIEVKIRQRIVELKGAVKGDPKLKTSLKKAIVMLKYSSKARARLAEGFKLAYSVAVSFPSIWGLGSVLAELLKRKKASASSGSSMKALPINSLAKR